MGTLASKGRRASCASPPAAASHVVCLGLAGAGKTSLLEMRFRGRLPEMEEAETRGGVRVTLVPPSPSSPRVSSWTVGREGRRAAERAVWDEVEGMASAADAKAALVAAPAAAAARDGAAAEGASAVVWVVDGSAPEAEVGVVVPGSGPTPGSSAARLCEVLALDDEDGEEARPLVVVVNKADRAGPAAAPEAIAEAWCLHHLRRPFAVVQASARSPGDADRAFAWVDRLAARRARLRDLAAVPARDLVERLEGGWRHHDLVTETGETLLTALCGGGNEGAASAVLDRGGAALDTRTSLGQTPLVRAAQAGHAAVVRMLLRRGADPSAAEEWSGKTALHRACEFDRAAAAEALLDAAAASAAGSGEPGRFGDELAEGFRLALLFGSASVARMLLRRHPGLRDEPSPRLPLPPALGVPEAAPARDSALFYAAVCNRPRVAAELLTAGCGSAAQRSAGGLTPLGAALRHGRPPAAFSASWEPARPGSGAGDQDESDVVNALLLHGAAPEGVGTPLLPRGRLVALLAHGGAAMPGPEAAAFWDDAVRSPHLHAAVREGLALGRVLVGRVSRVVEDAGAARQAAADLVAAYALFDAAAASADFERRVEEWNT